MAQAQQPPAITPAPSAAAPAAPAPAAPAAATAQPPAASVPLPSQPLPVSPGAPAAAPSASNVPVPAAAPSGLGDLQELSPWSMFLAADMLVKAVIISLIFASLVTWTVFLAKSFQLARARRQLVAALARIGEARSLNEARLALGTRGPLLSSLIGAAIQEARMSDDLAGEAGIKERVASHFAEIVRMEARAARYGMGVVATIGATAPFVGLFGTVWGIMNSFIGISKAHTTNLAVVAPGIAQALLATAVGLAAAIPAVIIYNHFSRVTKGYMELVGRGSGAIGRMLSRDLDRVHAGSISQAAE
jgi:biopolymer transport protein ExbB